MTTSTVPGSARRTRPRDRRDSIASSAGALFAEQGYALVTMATIAESVGITAGALYRHFPGKVELLAAAIALRAQQLGLGQPEDPREPGLGALLRRRAAAHVADATWGRLWLAESRRLPAQELAPLADQVVRERGVLAAAVRRDNGAAQDRVVDAADDADDADARAALLLAVLSSPTGHVRGLSRADHVDLLLHAGLALARTALPEAEPDLTGGGIGLTMLRSRRERVLAAAAEVLGMVGYEAASMADIGAVAGVSGPSLYGHVEGKDALVRALLERGEQALWVDLHEALATRPTAADALRAVADSYVRLGVRQPYVVALVVEGRSIPDLPRDRQVEYLREWVGLLRLARPALDDAAATALVQAAVNLVNTAVLHGLGAVGCDAGRVSAAVAAVLLESDPLSPK